MLFPPCRHSSLLCRMNIAVVLLLAGTMTMPGCARNNHAVTLAHLRKQGYITVGFADEAPYAYRSSATGRLTGESPVTLRIVMKRLGVQHIRGVLVPFGSLIPGLQAHRFDIIAAGMFITPARARVILFTNPTFAVGEGFIVKAGNPMNLHSYSSIAHNPKARLGVVTGSQEYRYAVECGIPVSRIVEFPDAPDAVDGVATGRVDAYGGTALTVQRIVGQLQKSGKHNLVEAKPFYDPLIHGHIVRGYGAFGLRKDESALCAAINRELSVVLSSKSYQHKMRQFGFTSAQSPGRLTAKKVCQLQESP